jgi:chaperonin GroEL (HSP60 family)
VDSFRARRKTKADQLAAALAGATAITLDGFSDRYEATGAKIVHRALEEPLRQIAENAG